MEKEVQVKEHTRILGKYYNINGVLVYEDPNGKLFIVGGSRLLKNYPVIVKRFKA